MMKVSCEKCKTLFRIEDKVLTSKGATVLCPKCQHPHLVKRVVIPYGDLKSKDSTKDTLKDIEDVKTTNEDNPCKSTEPNKALNIPGEETLMRRISKKAGMTTREILKSITDNPLIEKIEKKILPKSNINKNSKNDFKFELESQYSPIEEKPAIVYKINDLDPNIIFAPNENIVSYSDIQKIASHKKQNVEKPNKLGAFFISVFIAIIFLFLILILIIGIKNKYS